MTYPGDIYPILLSLTKTDGTLPNVTSAPLVTVINLADNSLAVTAQAMTLLAGSQLAYFYNWNTSGLNDGNYVAIVSYVADGVTVSSRFLEKVRLGDSRILDKVALDATTAKQDTVAKDATVAKAQDLTGISPDNSLTVAAIKAATDRIPAVPAQETTLTAISSTINDLHDIGLGTWMIDKTQTPQVLTFRRLDGSILATFQLTSDANQASRLKV